MKRQATQETLFSKSFPGLLIQLFGAVIKAPPEAVAEKLKSIERKHRRGELC